MCLHIQTQGQAKQHAQRPAVRDQQDRLVCMFPDDIVESTSHPLGNLGKCLSTRRRDMERVFELFPRLKERARQVAGTLSGGEQQMLAIGRSLMANPRLLLLDEPSMGLAPILVEAIFDTVSEINSQGTTILLVEQNALMALSIAQRGYVLETGEIVLHDSAAALQENEMVRKAYLGEE